MKFLINIFMVAILALSTFSARAEEKISLSGLKPIANVTPIEKEQKVFLYMWASWCPDCRDKLTKGTLENLQKEFPKVRVITINSDRDAARGKSFAEDEKLNVPVYRDDSKTLVKSLKLFAVPAWAVLEKNASGEWLVKSTATGSDLEEIKKEIRKVNQRPL